MVLYVHFVHYLKRFVCETTSTKIQQLYSEQSHHARKLANTSIQMMTWSTIQQINLLLLMHLLDCETNSSYAIHISSGQGRENNEI